MNSPHLLTLREVTKRYAAQRALRPCSLKIAPGEKILILGANGSGKSTLLRVAAGAIRASQGSIERDQQTAFLGQHLYLYPHLTVRENLKFAAKLFGSTFSIDGLLDTWDLLDMADRGIEDLSRGTQYRVALARTLLRNPRLIILDEPTSYLDQSTVDLLLTQINRCLDLTHGSVIIATHDIYRLRNFFNRAILLQQGELVADSGENKDDIVQILAQYSRENR